VQKVERSARKSRQSRPNITWSVSGYFRSIVSSRINLSYNSNALANITRGQNATTQDKASFLHKILAAKLVDAGGVLLLRPSQDAALLVVRG